MIHELSAIRRSPLAVTFPTKFYHIKDLILHSHGSSQKMGCVLIFDFAILKV
jgi:hypothetical protein